MQSKSWVLSAAERRAYAEDGFFIRRRAFSEKEVAQLCASAERAVARATAAVAGGADDEYEIDGNRYCEATGTTVQFEHRVDSSTIRVLEPFHHLDARFDRLIDDPRIVEPMRGLVESSRIALFTDKMNLKRPREGSRFRWHQDSPYWNHCCPHVDRLPNVMLALDDASERNGCLRVIRGSHRRGLLPGLEGQGRLGPLFTDPRFFDVSQQVPAEMPAGSLLFFSPHAVHGSEPNLSEESRRALVLTYQPGGHRMFKVDAKREAG
jgi:ectoine hydroxylase-related dioxygenase (phytanoyl-CoA dioxygenase family)